MKMKRITSKGYDYINSEILIVFPLTVIERT